MEKLQEKLQEDLDGFISLGEDRGGYRTLGYDSYEELLKNAEMQGAFESALWEQGYLQGIKDCISLLKMNQ